MSFHRSSLVSLLLILAAPFASAAALNLSRAFPAPNATQVCPDTPLRLTFDVAPALGGAGRIQIHDASNQAVVDTLDTSAADDKRMIGGTEYQYRPVIVTGREIAIYPHPNVLAYGKAYYVTIDAGVFKTGDDSSAAVDQPAAWKFTTKPAAPAATAGKFVIAADGTGDFCTVQGAIDFVPADNAKRIVFELRRGTYEEMVHIPRGKAQLILHGEDRKQTIITYANNARFNARTRSQFFAEGDDLTLENLTLRNTTAKGGSQAETIQLRADRCVLDHCDFSSLQDTLQLTGRAYVNECFVEGDVDYVWGSGSVYFNKCELKCLNKGYLVQSRNGNGRMGYVFVDCKLTATPNVTNYILARIEPGRFPYSHVAFINCAMGNFIAPVGWQFDSPPPVARGTAAPGTNGNAGSPATAAVPPAPATPPVPPAAVSLDHIQFQEYQSTTLDGKPLDVSKRHAASKQLTADEAAALRDVTKVLGGWQPGK